MLLENIQPMKIKKVHVDLDGVLANFVEGVNKNLGSYGLKTPYDETKYRKDRNYQSQLWRAISAYQRDGGRFWRELPLTSDANQLWKYLKDLSKSKGVTVEILTATGRPEYNSGKQKLEWVKQHFGDVKVNLAPRAVDKAKRATEDAILIDDQAKAIDPWKAAGGIGIIHTSAKSTIDQLKKIFDEEPE